MSRTRGSRKARCRKEPQRAKEKNRLKWQKANERLASPYNKAGQSRAEMFKEGPTSIAEAGADRSAANLGEGCNWVRPHIAGS